jgi:hypothetical protein
LGYLADQQLTKAADAAGLCCVAPHIRVVGGDDERRVHRDQIERLVGDRFQQAALAPGQCVQAVERRPKCREIQCARIDIGARHLLGMLSGKERLHPAAGPDVQGIDPRPTHREVGQRERGLRHSHNVFPIKGPSVLPVVADQQAVTPADPHRRLRTVAAAREQAGLDKAVNAQRAQRVGGVRMRNR